MDNFNIELFSLFLALLFGDESPQHSQQAGIIDPSVDVVAVIEGKISFVFVLNPSSIYLLDE